jgi:hypothetical protein
MENSAMLAFDELRHKLSHIRIAHHIQGRIRLKLDTDLVLPGYSDNQASQFQAVLDRIPGFHAVRVNFLARSCAVEYDPAVIPFQAWHDFLAGTDSHAASILEDILRNFHQEIINAKL